MTTEAEILSTIGIVVGVIFLMIVLVWDYNATKERIKRRERLASAPPIPDIASPSFKQGALDFQKHAESLYDIAPKVGSDSKRQSAFSKRMMK